MKFLLDEDLNPEVATIGRGLGLDVVSVHEADRRGLDDRGPRRDLTALPVHPLGKAKVNIADRDALHRAMEGG